MGPKLYVDISGQRFGHLLALKPTERRQHRQVLWECVCDCGSTVYVNTTDLKNGHTTSCGCVKSKGEELVSSILSSNGANYQREYSFDDLRTKTGGKLKFDFALFNEDNELCCLIEFQGVQHYQETTRNGFGNQQRLITDNMKREYCANKGIPLIEIRYDEDDVETIVENALRTHVNPVGKQ